ncbi:MAG: chromate resistance protein ChrB domain-containing protein [Acidithiobacillales bacterium]
MAPKAREGQLRERPAPAERRWYLLIHQIPPRPLYLRAKIRQRLERVGAVPLKKSVYVLPRTEDSLEDLQWIAQETVSGGGDAFVCAADFAYGVTTEELVARFQRARAADFEALTAEIRALLRALGPRRRKGPAPEDLAVRAARLRKRFEELTAIDFFETPARHEAEMALHSLEEHLRPAGTPDARAAAPGEGAKPVSRTWVTRAGVHIDRIGSAWLIRRFIDPEARFRFVPAGTKVFAPDEIRFDMVGGDFTHEEDRCTFETLVARFAIPDAAVDEIARIVHDVDVKDGKFGRLDAPGIQQLILGLVLAEPEDEARLERGFALFDDLYLSFSKSAPSKGNTPTQRTPRPRM